MTIAERYNAAASKLLPHMAADLAVDPAITDANHIDEMCLSPQRIPRRHGYRHSRHDRPAELRDPNMSAVTTIRIYHDTLPAHFDRSRPDAVAEAIQTALREDGVAAQASDVFSHLKIELPTNQLVEASRVLAELHLI